MNFIELAIHINERGEKVTSEKPYLIVTDKAKYERLYNGTWQQVGTVNHLLEKFFITETKISFLNPEKESISNE